MTVKRERPNPIGPSYQTQLAASPVRSQNAGPCQIGNIDIQRGGDASWLTAKEIAEFRLAGLPTTERGVRKRAEAEQWNSKPRPGLGGGRLYSALALPEDARRDFITRQCEQLDAQARPVGRPKGSGYFDKHPDQADAVEAFLAERKVSARNVLKLLKAHGFSTLPNMRTLQRFIAELEDRNLMVFTAIRDPDKAKSMWRPSLGRLDATVSYAHEMWEIDTTKVDIMCTDGRKAVLGIIDRWSRRARYLVVESESAQSVRRILVTTIAAWGVMPAILKVDHGSGFINATIGSALDMLGITLDPCLPGHPEDKPHVERLFGTFMRDRAALLPGFLGHNVADAQRLRARAKKETGRAVIEPGISSTELQSVIDGWIDGEYHLRTHSSLKMSPMEKWQRSPHRPSAAPGEDVLRIALSAYVGVGTVGKRGLRWKNGRYWSPALAPLMGRQVTMRRDEDDLGALFVFDENGRYIDTAVNFERSGFSEQKFSLAARRHVADHMAQAKAELRKKQRTYSFEKARDQLLRDEAAEAGRLTHLQPRTDRVTTAAIDSIAQRPTPPVIDQSRVDEALRRTERAVPVRKTVAAKVADADAIIAAADRGDAVDAAELNRARLYATSTEYRAEKITAGHFARDTSVAGRARSVAGGAA